MTDNTTHNPNKPANFAGISRRQGLISLIALSCMLATIFSAPSAPADRASQLDVDQQNLVSISAGWSALFLGPVGQEFVPNRRSLDTVELLLANSDTFSPFVGRVQINIREGSIVGPILGTSLPVDLPFGFADVVRFAFPSPVRLTPDQLHVIEIVVYGGGGNVCVLGGYGNAAGRGIFGGVPMPPSDTSALWFREGTLRGKR